MSSVYQSTRDPKLKATSRDAILKGLAPDGGLYIWPQMAENPIDLEKICSSDYMQTAKTVLGKLLPDFTEEEISECVEGAYTDNFDDPALTPVKNVDGVQVLEQSHWLSQGISTLVMPARMAPNSFSRRPPIG